MMPFCSWSIYLIRNIQALSHLQKKPISVDKSHVYTHHGHRQTSRGFISEHVKVAHGKHEHEYYGQDQRSVEEHPVDDHREQRPLGPEERSARALRRAAQHVFQLDEDVALKPDEFGVVSFVCDGAVFVEVVTGFVGLVSLIQVDERTDATRQFGHGRQSSGVNQLLPFLQYVLRLYDLHKQIDRHLATLTTHCHYRRLVMHSLHSNTLLIISK